MTERLKPKPMNRRDFLGLTSLWTAGAAIGVFLADIMRLPKPQVLPEASSWFRAGNPIEYPPGTLRVLAEQKVRIVSTPRGIAAMSMICTHLGCIVGETAEMKADLMIVRMCFLCASRILKLLPNLLSTTYAKRADSPKSAALGVKKPSPAVRSTR